jgi:hypothetical protein
MEYGTFKNITKKGLIIGFIACEKDSLRDAFVSVPTYRAFKYKIYQNGKMVVIDLSFDTEKEARNFIVNE